MTKLNTARTEAAARQRTIPVINSTKSVRFSTSQVLLVLALVTKLAVKSMHDIVQHVYQQSSYPAWLAMRNFRVNSSPYLAATAEYLMAKVHNWEHNSKEKEIQNHFCYPQGQRPEHTKWESPLPKGILAVLQVYCYTRSQRQKARAKWNSFSDQVSGHPLNISLEKLCLNHFQSLLQNPLLHTFG